MLLTLDIGNSNIDLGVFAGEALKMRAKLSATAERSSDEFAAMLFNLLQINHVDPRRSDRSRDRRLRQCSDFRQ